MHERQVACVEHLELGSHAELANPSRHCSEDPGRVHQHVVAACREVHRAAVERADLRPELLDVREPLGGSREIGGLVERERRLVAAEHEVAAHARRQVHDHVGAGRADTIDHLGVKLGIARTLAGGGIADVDVHDGSAGLRGLDRGRGDLLRRDRNLVRLSGRISRTGDGAGDEDVPPHGDSPLARLGAFSSDPGWRRYPG